jgi:beta-glucanase (GH16 family)
MRVIIKSFLAFIFLLYSCKKDQTYQAKDSINKPGWELTFQDEFNEDKLNRNIWVTNLEWGQTIGEGQYTQGLVVDSAVSVSDGKLKIRLKREAVGAYLFNPEGTKQTYHSFEFTCGMVNSRHAFEQSQGYFEARIRAPRGKGYWPAFWLLSGNSWPPEIDIFEMQGRDTRLIHFANHFGTYEKNSQVANTWYGPDFASDFHLFAIEWDANKINWFVDNTLIFSSSKHVPKDKMYVVISSGIGAEWSGYADETTPDVSYLETDYVRVYKRAL